MNSKRRLYFSAGVLTAFSLFLLSSVYSPPQKEIIKEITTIEKPVVVEKEKKILINRYVDGLDVNTLIKFYGEKHPEDLQKIVSFYDKKTNSREITNAIIESCVKYNIPVNTGFALAYRESKFVVNRVSKNSNGSYDRGLFQLNDKERKDWKRVDFYNPFKNSKEAIGFLSWLYDEFGKDINLALAAYNAGFGRISRESIPFTTAQHVFTIRDYEKKLDEELSLTVLPTLNHLDFFN